MTLKSYQTWKLAIVVLLSFLISFSITIRNYFIPIAATVVASIALLQLRKSVKEIVADERDMAIGGKAALLAIRVFAWLAIVPIFVLYAMRDRNPFYEPIGMTLAYSVCILMLLYAVLFKYYNKISMYDKKTWYSIVVLIGFILLAIASVRLFSGEDDWICRDGQWVKHGNPSFPAPLEECK